MKLSECLFKEADWEENEGDAYWHTALREYAEEAEKLEVELEKLKKELTNEKD